MTRPPGSTALPLVLASASPRRSELLRLAGFDFVVDPADTDETIGAGEPAVDYVRRVAAAKCDVVAARHPLAVVLAADTTVAIDGEILAKPADPAAAAAMISRLSGRTHQVHTAVVARAGDARHDVLVTTDVTFAVLDPATVAWYVGLGESLDKAGGYGIQSAGGALIERVDGSPTNVIGLPLPETLALLRRFAASD